MDELLIRDATAGDAPRMALLRSTAAMHADRVVQADGASWRYLVIEHADAIAGWGCLIFSQPKLWPSCKQMPRLIDLFIAPALRGRGLGSRLLAYMETELRARGFEQVFISVDPANNRRAWALYERRGFTPLSDGPEWTSWEYLDSAGNKHTGEGWDITLVKKLHARPELTELEQLAAEVLARMTPERAASVRARGYINIEPYCGQVVPVSITPAVLAAAAREGERH